MVDTKCFAVTSSIVRHTTSAELAKGETEDVVITSRGIIRLGRSAETLVEEFERVWSVNCIIARGGTIYIGTSPNGGVYEFSLGELKEIYSASPEEDKASTPAEANQPADANVVEAETHLANEHIFAMNVDVAGRLLVGISGKSCRLCRLSGGELETVYEPNEAKYIFAIETDDAGNIYLGTGPEGNVYKLDSFGRDAQPLYKCRDKNILSLVVGEDGFIYAGSDERGLIYKLSSRDKTASVVYDSEQPEITSLLFRKDNGLYAAATSAQIVKAQNDFAETVPMAGRPEAGPEANPASSQSGKGGMQLRIAHSNPGNGGNNSPQDSRRQPSKPGQQSQIYKVTPQGYVSEVFAQPAVIFTIAARENEILAGTGNKAQLFSIDPEAESHKVLYEHPKSSQVAAIAVEGNDIYVGTANPATLVKLSEDYASEGSYVSELVDAGQPARWGKLQVEADIPEDCILKVCSRSGNVGDINDPTFSKWTSPVEMTGPTQLQCPLGRFCQYKIILKSPDGRETPSIREIAVPYTVPNLAPDVESVTVSGIDTPDKKGVFKIEYKASDKNEDQLIYNIDFRKIGWASWIEIEDKINANNYEWDAKTVEDGRYEIRITADDRMSNTTETAMTGTRVSDPVVVDNSGPEIGKYTIQKSGNDITLKLKVLDQLSAIGSLHYTINSDNEWKGTLPEDKVYDTTTEDFSILIEDLDAGEHIIAVKIADSVQNITYKTFRVNID